MNHMNSRTLSTDQHILLNQSDVTTDKQVVGRIGIEPMTPWLKARCSTTELTTQFADGKHRQKRSQFNQ